MGSPLTRAAALWNGGEALWGRPGVVLKFGGLTSEARVSAGFF